MWRAYRWPSLAARLRPGPAGVSPPGVRLGSESLFGFGRNGCSASLGIGVRLQSERPLGFRRNLHEYGAVGGMPPCEGLSALLAEVEEAGFRRPTGLRPGALHGRLSPPARRWRRPRSGVKSGA